MRNVLIVARRELYSYFSTPLAAIFLIVFLGSAGAVTFYLGHFFERGQAELSAFFSFHPWLFLVLMPAIGMRLWAEERRSGTLEFIMTLPVETWQLVLGKFLAAWAFAGLALALTAPIWITVNYLGDPDNGVIFASYAGAFLMGGAFLALASFLSALTSNQVTAFVLSVAAGFLMLMSSLDPVLALIEGWAPALLVDLVASLSFARHFSTITRGVLDLRDVVFFLSFIALMLSLNVLLLDLRKARGPMSGGANRRIGAAALSVTGMALAIVLFLALNFASTLKLGVARLDLTEKHLYTLGESARDVLAGVDEPIRIRFYRSRQFLASSPRLQSHFTRVSELLSTFQQLSGGKLTVETVETAPFSAEEDQALGYGLRGFQFNPSGERGYLGLVGTNAADDVETIAFLDPSREAYLEYDLTRLVHRLDQPEEPVVRIVDGLSMFGSLMERRAPWAILDLIGQNVVLDTLAGDATSIPADTDVLLVTHPVLLAPQLEYAIDQYVLRGGAALFFIDPFAEHAPQSIDNPYVPQEPASDPETLLAAWGVDMDPQKVVGDATMALQTVAVAGQQRIVTDYLPWLRVDGEAFNRDEPITAQLEIMRMSTAGAITNLPGATTTVTPLIMSSQQSMLLDQKEVVRRPDPNVFLDKFVASGYRQSLAVRISGPASTAFPDGPPPPAEDDGAGGAAPEPQSPAEQVATGEVNVVVVADTDLLADNHVVDGDGQLISSNADFVLNAIENLAGGNALIGARGGGLSYRPFTTVEAIQERAEEKYRATEQRLSTELADIQDRLLQLQQPGQPQIDDPIAASREQQEAIGEFNARMVDLRQQLREVRAALRADIERLETRLKLFNIVFVPAILVIFAILLDAWRRIRFSRSMRRHSFE